MSYSYRLVCPDGSIDYEPDDEVYDTYEEAEEAALEALGAMDVGAELLHESNPGDYYYEDNMYGGLEIEVYEIDEE